MKIYIFKDTISNKYFCINTYEIKFRSLEEMETKGFKPRMMYSLEKANKFIDWIITCMMCKDYKPERPNFYYGIDKENYNIVRVKLGDIKNE